MVRSQMLLAVVEHESAGDDLDSTSHAINERVVGDFTGMSSTSIELSSSLNNQSYTYIRLDS